MEEMSSVGLGGLRHSGAGMCQEGKGWGEEGQMDLFFKF